MKRKTFPIVDGIPFYREMMMWCENHPRVKIWRNEDSSPMRYICPKCKEIFTKQSRPDLFE